MPGVIDHHQPNPEVAESCVTSLVVQKAEEYIGHLKNESEITIITHFVPDLDATASVYFAIKYLEGKTFSEKESLIAEYVLEVDSGKLSIDPENPLGIASLWLAVTDEKSDKRPWERDNKALIEKGIRFFNEIIKTLSNFPRLLLLSGTLLSRYPVNSLIAVNIFCFSLSKTSSFSVCRFFLSKLSFAIFKTSLSLSNCLKRSSIKSSGIICRVARSADKSPRMQ
jgi:hypothetical protein